MRVLLIAIVNTAMHYFIIIDRFWSFSKLILIKDFFIKLFLLTYFTHKTFWSISLVLSRIRKVPIDASSRTDLTSSRLKFP